MIFPKYRGDLVQTRRRRRADARRRRSRRCATRATRSTCSPSRSSRWSRWTSGTVDDAVRRSSAAPRRSPRCPRSAFDAVLDMLSGRYPSRRLRRAAPAPGLGPGRPARSTGAAGRATARRHQRRHHPRPRPVRRLPGRARRPARVGELDEEMVYESRVGDVFTLGSTSLADRGHHPRPGAGHAGARASPARLPFWKGDTLGRPVELGRGARRLHPRARARCAGDGRREPRAAACRARRVGGRQPAAPTSTSSAPATGHLPDDRTIVVERFRDELGDWRVAIHSPFGAPVHAPWALVVSARLRERYGVDVQAMHSDDGIVLRLPDIELDEATRPAPAPRWRSSSRTRSSRW